MTLPVPGSKNAVCLGGGGLTLPFSAVSKFLFSVRHKMVALVDDSRILLTQCCFFLVIDLWFAL